MIVHDFSLHRNTRSFEQAELTGHPENYYLFYQKMCLQDQSIQKIINWILKRTSLTVIAQAELTAGINHTSQGEGYVPIIRVFKNWDCNVLMSACEMNSIAEPNPAAADSEDLVMHIRACTSALHLTARNPLSASVFKIKSNIFWILSSRKDFF